MDIEHEERLDESFYRDPQWIAQQRDHQYLHENNGDDVFTSEQTPSRILTSCSSFLLCSVSVLRQTVE